MTAGTQGTCAAAVDDGELFAELTRRLREHVDPGVRYAEGAFVLHRWDVATDPPGRATVLDPPLRFHVTPRQLGAVCRETASDAVSAFGGQGGQAGQAGQAVLDLLPAHLDETLEVGFDRAPGRRHVLIEPYLAFVDDPAVPGRPLPPSGG